MGVKLLVVEESDSIRTAIRNGLANEGFSVDVAANDEDGLWLANQNDYDALIFERAEVSDKLRPHSQRIPLLQLTDEEKRAQDFSELFERIRNAIRRRPSKQDVINVEDLVIDTTTRMVVRGGTLISLSPREYALLEFLAQRPGQLVKRHEIWEHVYDFRGEVQSNVVDVYISYLRRKLGQPQLIHTRRGEGYLLGAMP